MPLKTLLLIPPKYEIDFPPLGTPALAGFLKSRGKIVDQMDANHEYHVHWMDKLEIQAKDALPRPFKLFALRHIFNAAFLAKENTDVYYASCLKNFFPTAPYNDWTDSSYHFAENLLDSDFLHRFLEDEKENTSLQYYRESRLAERMIEQGVDLLGISVIGPSQIIATLTLAKHLKELEFDGLITRMVTGTDKPRIVYAPTERSRSLAPVLAVIQQWGAEHLTTYDQEWKPAAPVPGATEPGPAHSDPSSFQERRAPGFEAAAGYGRNVPDSELIS